LRLEAEQDPEKVDQKWARLIHRVEKEFHFLVDGDYPFLKLLSQLDYLHWEAKEIKKQSDKNK